AILLISSRLTSDTPNSALMSALVHSRRSKIDCLTISLAIRAATPSLLYSNTLVTSVLQLCFHLVSDLPKVLSLGPQKVDASAAHLATLVGRGDELAVEIKKHFPPLHHRVVYTQLGVDLALALILTDAFATSH